MESTTIHPTVTSTFTSRAAATTTSSTPAHPLTTYLLRLMTLKNSNLCLSADVSTARELLTLASRLGPSIVVLKTHHDLISGWDFNPHTGTGARLAALARKHGFLIFEDRKFADIGSTVQQQYVGGSARIVEWAHITNVNMIPGAAVVTALAEAAARWKERINYEVRTSVTAGGVPYPEDGEEGDQMASIGSLGVGDPRRAGADDGRKGSIVSITTVTQTFEPTDSSSRSKNHNANPEDSISSGINGCHEDEEMGEGSEEDKDTFPGIEPAPSDRGLLILAQMSSEGNFMTPTYTRACIQAARKHPSFVMGFVAQQSLNSEPEDNFLTMTPGCQLPPRTTDGTPAGSVGGDGLGQRYNTPQKIVEVAGCDIIIVGRGIIKADDPQGEAERYRKAAWKAYLERVGERV